jgi:hypothetical protein
VPCEQFSKERGSAPEPPQGTQEAGTAGAGLADRPARLQADANLDYDWTLIAGLEVDLMADRSVSFGRVLDTLAALADAVPRQMVLSYRGGAQVDCGQWRIAGAQTYFDWFPIALSPRRAKPTVHVHHYLEGKKLEHALWAEMGKRLPIPWDLEMDRIAQKIAGERQCA